MSASVTISARGEERLHHEVIAVPVHDQRRQQVGLRVHEPIGIRVNRQSVAEGDGALNPGAQQRQAGCRLAVGQHPDRNLRSIAEQRAAERAIPRSEHPDDLAALRLHVDDISAVDPGVPASHPLLSTGGDGDGRSDGQSVIKVEKWKSGKVEKSAEMALRLL